MEEKDVMLTSSANKDGMTSFEIAEVTGRQHQHIMREIRNLLSKVLTSPTLDALNTKTQKEKCAHATASPRKDA